MKNTICLFLLVFCTISINAQNSDKDILNFTKNNYLSLINSIPKNNLGEFGFNSKEEIQHLRFTKVLTEFSVIDNSLVKTHNYRVIAENTHGIPCGLFTVFEQNNELKIVDYGAKELALEIKKDLVHFNSKNHISILRAYTHQADYLFDNSLNSNDQKFYKIFNNNFFSLNDIISH